MANESIWVEFYSGDAHVCQLFTFRDAVRVPGCLLDPVSGGTNSHTLSQYGHAADGAAADHIAQAYDFHAAGA